MKTILRAARQAGVSFCLLVPMGLSAVPTPGELFDPAAYEQRMNSGPGFTPPVVVHSQAELKMSSQLASLTNSGLRRPGATPDDVKAEMVRLGQIRGPSGDQQFHVYVRATEASALPGIRALLVDAVVAPPEWPMAEWPLVAGWVRESDLEALALMGSVVFIQAVDPPHFRAGSVTTEGDALHMGPQARSAPLSLNGNGMKVGVISNGVTSLAAAQATGDLPMNTIVLGVGSGDEGTAMLEIIHDLAPGADLYFAPSGADRTSFGNAVAALHAQGCQIICDDLGWYLDPFFEHSPTGLLIGNLQGIRDYLHVSAAGNDAQLHHQQVFTDANSDGWHDPYLIVRVPNGAMLDVFMQWKEPLNGTPVSDYDLYFADYNTMGIIASGQTRGKVGETVYYTNNTGATIDVAVYVYRQGGSVAHDIEIFIEPKNGATQFTNSTSPVDAIFGHPGFGTVFSAVATDVATPSQIEWFSSQGPFTIIGLPHFQPKKPDFAAADGVSITGAGGFPVPFFGTSAAAPHVAGVLALVWSRKPGTQAADFRISAFLSQVVTDLGTNGYDNIFGYGRPLADAWANAFNDPPVLGFPAITLNGGALIPRKIPGLSISDPDAGTNPLMMTLSVNSGLVFIDPTVPGGLTPVDIQFNSSANVQIIAPQTAIQNTFSAHGAVVYLANPVPPGAPVADTLVLWASDLGSYGMGGVQTAGGSVNLVGHHHLFDAWLHDHFDAAQLANPAISGDNADPDGDFHVNQWEFFTGTDPHAADTGLGPTVAVQSGNLVFHYRVSKDIPYGSPHSVSVSPDLTNWTDVWFNRMIQHPSETDAWIGEVIRPITPGSREFLRLRFTARF